MGATLPNPPGGRMLTDEDIDAIAHRLAEFSGLTPEEHREHHEAFAVFIDAQRRKAQRWDKIQEQVGGWMIIVVLGGLGTAAWHGFLWVIAKGH